MNTPVFLLLKLPGLIPACSMAHQVCVNNNRCCGSMTLASRGEISKNSGSNSSTPLRKPPQVILVFPNPLSGLPNMSRESQRPFGTSDMQSFPSTISFQNSSRLAAPGKLPDMPTIATSCAETGLAMSDVSCDGGWRAELASEESRAYWVSVRMLTCSNSAVRGRGDVSWRLIVVITS